MIEAILPVGVHAAEEFGEAHGGTLLPEEEAVVANAAPKRRDEFAAVRRCARRALIELDRPPAALLPGPGGAPVWPDGVVGSMTHCRGYRGAVVADRSRLATIGIDAEPDEPLPADVLPVIARPDEIGPFRAAESVWPVNGDRLLFSAKESVYKAWYPLTQRWLDFDDVSVTPDPHRRRFSARVLAEAPDDCQHFSGTWTAANGLILTACVLSRL
ncbi:4'-phosphopantetheinyl transferase family protein [Rathayibacter tanaceti]|uniref:4'-phosphopantetheinyl transferase Npt n=2 Tax=Rathayibacter tanaceti TaxID=1671680 RepID=A0A166HRP3_9MICO|nr:4'-phosphopantetheinyl transferase superfamily protein [Rathayibacter tanaceti]KZX21063.1 4'-phosphopantetheinyl transferase Npt [Rathayibacter tanaceti]QHC55210.1 4'-phosphopantetheinyl transferase superfamily protein [Rathayibacter tanaceti]TCO36500.1 4'-phosphopantetheinyl transferase EntD [Rathayibacter tanaceti]